MTRKSHSLTGLFAGRYMIERSVGRGASATVYLAHDTKQDRQIALKVLDKELAHALGAQRFLQEIHITSRLQHPHILPIHDSGEWEGLLYYVLPFVAGESLRERLDREKQLPIEDCVQLTCDVASALAHAHSKGVIHRDVKPENIMLSEGHALVADFGIARTIDVHTGERLTSSGLIVGTSQYMSPEQASGEREVDERSDIYSLGCVLYEMLAGIEPFVGPNVQAVIAQRFTHTPRPVRTYRPTIPDYLEPALDKALAIAPADRFKTMKDFAAALPAMTSAPDDRRRPGRGFRDVLRTRRGKFSAAAGVALVAAFTAAALSGKTNFVNAFGSPKLDSSLYVVLPMVDPRKAGLRDGSSVSDVVYKGLQTWSDVPLVPEANVADVVKDEGNPTSLRSALAVARQLKAGRLIWGRVGSAGNRNVHLQLFDVVSGATLRELDLPLTDTVETKVALQRLLRDAATPRAAWAGDGMARSFVAWKAYGRGHAALKRWDLASARRAFDSAKTLDPEFAPARLWSAQLQYWKSPPDSAGQWITDAAVAASKSEAMSQRDRLLAVALNAMGVGNFPHACLEYAKLTKLDSLDFVGWNGLAECQSRDLYVLPSQSSPSGWRYRSSANTAVENYRRSLKLEPGAHAIVSFEEMQRLLPISTSKMRGGYDEKGSLAFLAYPSLADDTLVFVPYPRKKFANLPSSALATRNEALEKNAERLFEFVTSWTRAYQGNAEAFEGLALILEARGDIFRKSSGSSSASDAVAKALALASDQAQRIRLAATEVRLRIKRGEFSSANSLADSILSRSPRGHADQELVSLAAFVGRMGVMSQLLADDRSRGATLLSNLFPELRSTAGDLFARAALGDCSQATSGVERRLLQQLESYVTPEKRAVVKSSLMTRSYSMLTPCTDGASALKIDLPENHLYRLQQAYAKRNLRAGRILIDSLSRGRTGMRPGDLALDHTYQEAWIKAAIGDTVAATTQLDLALNAMPALSSAALKEASASAAVGRAMAFRAELASKLGDRETASRWSTAVMALWRNGDSPLGATINRMRAIAGKQ